MRIVVPENRSYLRLDVVVTGRMPEQADFVCAMRCMRRTTGLFADATVATGLPPGNVSATVDAANDASDIERDASR